MKQKESNTVKEREILRGKATYKKDLSREAIGVFVD